MNFLPILVAMYGMGTPKEDDFEVTGRSGLRMAAASRDYELRSNVVLDDPAYMYGELSKEDFGDIALSVKRTEEAPYFAHSEATEGLSFPDLPGYFDTSGNLKYFVPQGPDKVKPRFLLHSNKAKEPGKLLFETGLDWVGFSDMASMIDPGQKLYIIVHGFLSSAKTEWMQDMKNEILDKENASVVLVDWSKGCGSVLGYSTAAANTRTVARTLALLVKTLADAGAVALEHVHYIGHSLGAQTGGFFGKDVKQLTGGLVGRITACSHSKATEFYADSVRYCNFPTRSCKSYDDFLAGTCASSCADGRTCGHMGHPASMPLTGNHFTKTSKQQCAFKPVRINLRTQTVSRTLDPDAMLINSLGRSAKILLEEAEPEERRELLDALREEMAVRTGQRSAYAD
ncbi:phospholipase A1-like isoform X2 [Rhipicephalus sanguineus]|uniref:phospholipase A1-like isoform X2 n=1 Tax=Rhipicephalus sanguineus TaxID=34632 RepID=UPI0020C49C45|nr:phospholipase A1-like isoform X2 [Rhipicephalus sanguineus]